MIQALTAKPSNLNLIPRNHMVEGKNHGVYVCVCVSVHTHTQTEGERDRDRDKDREIYKRGKKT